MAAEDLTRLVRRRCALRASAAQASADLAGLFRTQPDPSSIEAEIPRILGKVPVFSHQATPMADPAWNWTELAAHPDLRASARIFLARRLSGEGVVLSASDFPEVSAAGLACLFRLCQLKAAMGRKTGALLFAEPRPGVLDTLTISDAYLLACFPTLSPPKPAASLVGWDRLLASSEMADFWSLVTCVVQIAKRSWPASPVPLLFTSLGRQWMACNAFRGLRRALIREQLASGRRVGGPPAFFTTLLDTQGAGFVLQAQQARLGVPMSFCAMAAEAARLVDSRKLASQADAVMWASMANALLGGCRDPQASALFVKAGVNPALPD